MGKTLGSLSIDWKVDLLNEALLNIFQNYITNIKIKCDSRQPPWMTKNTKRSLKERSKLTKYYKNDPKKSDYEKLLENLLIVLNKFWKLKIITFLKWPKSFKIQRLLQGCAGLF